jgi:hypothetical protein
MLQTRVGELETERAQDIAQLKKKMDHVDAMMEALKGAIDANSKAPFMALKESLGWT